jgi:tetratricopeptide (TPR) repeat protein
MASASIKAVSVACLLALATSIGMGGISFAQIIGTRNEATSCASAIGGNVSASTVSVVCGIPPEVLDALVKSRTQTLEELASSHKETIALLKQNLDLNQRQIRAAPDILGEKNVPPERLANKLLEIAEHFKDLQQTAIAKPGDDPKIASLKADAKKVVGEGDLDKADQLLAEVELEQGRALDRLTEDKADTAARRGDIAMTRLRYGEAAKHYADAAAVLASASTGEQKRLDFLNKEVEALYQQGYEFGDNAALRAAIDRYRGIINLQPRERVPLDWAMTQNNLGTALERLGGRENDTGKLEEAVAAYRAALQELTRERFPLKWASAQNNLGNALATLGERESSTARLEEAVAAYREALQEWTPLTIWRSGQALCFPRRRRTEVARSKSKQIAAVLPFTASW